MTERDANHLWITLRFSDRIVNCVGNLMPHRTNTGESNFHFIHLVIEKCTNSGCWRQIHLKKSHCYAQTDISRTTVITIIAIWCDGCAVCLVPSACILYILYHHHRVKSVFGTRYLILACMSVASFLPTPRKYRPFSPANFGELNYVAIHIFLFFF